MRLATTRIRGGLARLAGDTRGRKLVAVLLRGLAAVFLWGTVVSGRPHPEKPVEPIVRRIVDNGVQAEAPNGTLGVKVREHHIYGFRVTEVVVGRADFDDVLPAIVHIHGRGSRPEVPVGDHTATEPMRMWFPWAPDRLGDGFTWFPVSITNRVEPKVLGHYILQRSDELAHVIKTLLHERPTEGRAIVTGFSQGAMLTLGLALQHPDLFDGAYPIAGWFPLELLDDVVVEGRRYPEIHGLNATRDPVIPLEQTRRVFEEMQELGVTATLESFRSRRHAIDDVARQRYRGLIQQLIRRRRVVDVVVS